MKTRNLNDIDIRKGKSSGFYTDYCLFYKEGGVKYYIDSVSLHNDGTVSSLYTRNSNTGRTNVLLPSELENGRFSKTFFFTK